jgi:5-methylcytosine-specific restriction endonuclease McrA
MLRIITRARAKEIGLSRYYTGKPCIRGHIAERMIGGNCIQCNNDRNLAARRANPQRHQSYVKAWEKRNIQKRKEIEARANKKYREKNREMALAYARAWAKENPGKALAHCRERQVKKLQRTPRWANLTSIRTVYEHAAALSRATGIKMHVDHIIPLRGKTVSGLHVPWNLQIIPAVTNIAKGNRL